MTDFYPVNHDYFKDYYKANKDGLILSNDYNHTGKPGLIQLGTTWDGYKTALLQHDNIRQNCRVHILIAKTFLPNPNNLPEVHHINGDKIDNRVENLMWIDRKTHDREHKGKPVACIKNDNIVKIYSCIMECEEDGHCNAHVSKCCNHIQKYKSHHGFQWEFLENVSPDLINKYNKHNN